MSTTLPVPSADPADLLFNAGLLDEVVSSGALTYIDRLGVVRLTAAGAMARFAALNPRGAWVTTTLYSPRDLVLESGTWYIALDSHTSGATFAGDLAAHWRPEQGVTAADLANVTSALLGVGLVRASQSVTYDAGTLGARYNEVVSVKDGPYFAVGDGVTDDYLAIQAAVDSGAKRIHLPAGTYYSSQAIKLPHTGSYFRRDTGVVIEGDGIFTILTRNSTATQGATETNWVANAFFSVFGSYNVIQNLQLHRCPIAIYFGQDPDQVGVESSHTSFNKMTNLLIQDCGTGILSACALGHYYNTYQSIHIAQCQIGVYFTVHSVYPTPTLSNNNRNTFLNVRAARCQVGLWLANGDTNSVYSFHCEGCGDAPTNNTYTSPSGLPGGLTTAAHIVEKDNNSFMNCFHEACDFYLYQAGLMNSYIGCLYRVDEHPTLSVFVNPPDNWTSRSETWLSNGAFAYVSNTHTTAFPNAVAGAPTLQSIGGVPVQHRPGSTALTNVTFTGTDALEKIVELGAVGSGGTAAFTLWADVSNLADSVAVFSVDIVGVCVASSLAHATTCRVLAFRNSSRTLTRYYLYDTVSGRATGANAGDATEPLVPTLSVSTKDLVLTVTAPARVFANISVVFKRLFTQ